MKMDTQSLCFIFFLTISASLSAQTNILKINPGIVMPEDSIGAESLIVAVSGFLYSAHSNSENKWVLTSEAVETQMLIDEIEGIQKNESLEEDNFYKAYLTNIIPVEDSSYAVHIAYIGTKEDSVFLRGNFELLAHKTKDQFLITSPLTRNTQNWQTEKIENQVYHYPYSADLVKIRRFHELTSMFDKKLDNNDGQTHYYLCDDEINPLEIFGVKYKSDYNGEEFGRRFAAEVDDKSLFIMNATRFYNYPEHDVWHFRLGQVISRRDVHRRVDCHYGTLYGGLWGISWEELFTTFSEKYVVSKNVNWLDHKEKKTHFITNGRRKNYTDDFVGALIVQEIEKEKGFQGVWELLMTKRTQDEAEYFATVEKLIGISKNNYNREVYKLIKEEMKSLGIKHS